MNDSQNQVGQDAPPVPNGFPAASPVAAPSDFFPPASPTPPRSPINGKIVATFLGLALMVGGVGAGVVLVSQPQLLEQQAQVIYTPMVCCTLTANALDCPVEGNPGVWGSLLKFNSVVDSKIGCTFPLYNCSDVFNLDGKVKPGMNVCGGGYGGGSSDAYVPPPVCSPGSYCQSDLGGWGSNKTVSCNQPTYTPDLMSGVSVVTGYKATKCCAPGDVKVGTKCMTACPTNEPGRCDPWIQSAYALTHKCATTTGSVLACCPAGQVHTNYGCDYKPGVNNACSKDVTVTVGYSLPDCTCYQKYICGADKKFTTDGKCTYTIGTLTKTCPQQP